MTICSTWLIAALATSGAATAQDTRPYPYPVTGITVGDPRGPNDLGLLVRGADEHLATDMGVALMLGGGSVTRLTDREENATSPGGAWHARLVIGTRSFVAGEAAYVGSAAPVQPDVVGTDDVLLLSNGGEGALRAQVPVVVGIRQDVLVAPFATAGVGVQVHDLMNQELEILGDRMVGNDFTVHVPVGGGLMVASEGFIADARLAYRPAVANDRRVFGTPSRFDNAIDEVAVTGSIGVEF
jgi:hypothetical protein